MINTQIENKQKDCNQHRGRLIKYSIDALVVFIIFFALSAYVYFFEKDFNAKFYMLYIMAGNILLILFFYIVEVLKIKSGFYQSHTY